MFVKYAGRLSPDRGCCKDTSGRTPVSELGEVMSQGGLAGGVHDVGFSFFFFLQTNQPQGVIL